MHIYYVHIKGGLTMEHPINNTRKQTINLSIQKTIIHEAKELDLNLSRNAEKGIEDAIKEEYSRRWKEENKAAIKAHNERVDNEGLLINSYWIGE